MRRWSVFSVVLGILLGPLPALAAGCFPVARNGQDIVPAAFRQAAIPADSTVQLTYLGHSSFLIETRGGVTAVTDYNGYNRPSFVPDIVTMNNAHSTHYTSNPDPGIGHVLRGWNPSGGWAEHNILVEDLRVRNVPTAVHGRSGTDALSNSMFVFEVEDLCIAHLGHLHHVLTREQVGEIGQIDIVLVPVDGSYTMSQDEMFDVLDQIRAELVIPMHFFGPTTLGRFLALAERKGYEVVRAADPVVALSRMTLPHRQVMVLPGS